MTKLTVETVIEAWTNPLQLPEALKELMNNYGLQDGILKLLAQGEPVSAERLAKVSGAPLEQVRAMYRLFDEAGAEFDEDGRLVGAALTLNPTPHRFRVNGRQLYAWCALDTIFLPGLLGETAVVESTDPVNNQPIRLTVAPDGITNYAPETLVLSITVPGLSCRTENSCGPDTGPQSETCSQMHFFSSRENAEVWLQNRPGIAIFTIEQAWQLAQANWLAQKRRFETGEMGH